jgi:hypothetical protein
MWWDDATTRNDRHATTAAVAVRVTTEMILQRYVLAVLYFATSGPVSSLSSSWTVSGWLHGPECGGGGGANDTAPSLSSWPGVTCHANGTVQMLQFGTDSQRFQCGHAQKDPCCLFKRRMIPFSSLNGTVFLFVCTP